MNALHLDWLADPPKLPADTPRLDLTFKLDLRVDGQAPHAPLVIAVGVVGEMIGAPSRVLVGLRDAIREALDDQDRLILLGEEAPSPFDFKGALSAGAEALRRINPEFNRRILLLVHGQELISPGSYEILTKQGIGLDVITVDPDVEQGAFVRFAALLGGEAMAVNPESALSLAEGRARALKAARYPGARLTLTPLGPTTLQRLYRLSPSPVFLGDIPEGPVSLDLGPLAPPPSWIITAELPRLHVGLYEALAAELTWLEKGEPRVERQTLLLESTAEAAELRAVRADVIAARHLAQATAWPEEILMALRRADGRQIIRTLDASLQHFLAFEAFDKASEIEGLRVRFLRRGMLRFQDINRLRRLLASVTTPPL